jgi:hypothetical protein
MDMDDETGQSDYRGRTRQRMCRLPVGDSGRGGERNCRRNTMATTNEINAIFAYIGAGPPAKMN